MTSAYLEDILTTATLREPAIKAAIKALELPKNSNGLDVGCGPGLQCQLLAEDIGPSGHVTGLDISPEFLAYGEKLVKSSGMSNRITLKEGSGESIPFEDNSFDWAWSVDCVGYGPWEPMPLLEEMRRVIRPDGTLAILAWSFEHLLPGHPLLEVKLRATTSGLAPFEDGMDPSRHFSRSLGLLRKLGLNSPKADTFPRSVHAPLSDDLFKAMTAIVKMRWPGAIDELKEEDRMVYKRLCNPDSKDFILRHPDYYAFFTYSMFFGIVS